MKISIIIPVYNSNKYLEKCIESIRMQSYSNFEIVLVDDGSTDGSEKICEQFAELDARIKCIHQKNSGTSAARNTGMKNATGEYIMFMDNDDYWNDNSCLSTISAQLQEMAADVLLFSTISYWEDKDLYVYPQSKCVRSEVVGKKPEEALKCLIENGLFYRAVWSKVIKREVILNNEIWFPVGMRNEDSEWTAHLMLCAKSYDWMETPFYVYRKGHFGAQTSKPNTYKIVSDLKEIIIKYYKIAKENEMQWTSEFKYVYLSYFAYLYSVWMAQAEMIKNTQIKEDINEMKKYVWILNYDLDPSVKLVRKVCRICGYHMTAKLLKIYMKNKYNIKDSE